MRRAWIAWLFAGCGFTAQPIPGSGGDPPDPAPDPGGGSDSGSGSGTGSAAAYACDVTDPSLRLCLTFDHLPMVADLAVPPHALVEATGVRQILRLIADAGAALDSRTRIRFADAPDLDVSELTVDAWIAPAAIPRRASYFVFDNDTQYFASYEDDERVRCGIGSAIARSNVTFRQSWHHIACRYDTALRQLRIYVDGNVSGCTSVPTGIPSTGTSGLAIGANYGPGGFRDSFVGNLDGLHLYARALGDAEICRAAGRTTCNATCPGGGGGG